MAYDERAILAANNNADLYEAMFQAWALRYERRPSAFVGRDRPPPFYSNLTVLAPGARDEIISHLRGLALRFGGSVGFKDSFCEFDHRASGLSLLFQASWIWRSPSAGPGSDWLKVGHQLELEEWEAAWKRAGSPTDHKMFRNSLLRDDRLTFLYKREAGQVVSGCIANLSDGCVGISNVFSLADEVGSFAEATAAVASMNPRLPIAGYARGPRLIAALQAGFEATGDLRILNAQDADF